MEYEGYLTREEILERVEIAFPFVDRPSCKELFVFDKDDIMRKIIESGISKYVEPELAYEGVLVLYDEFSTISQKAVQWMFPSFLRFILKKTDLSGNFHWYLPTYFENLDLVTENSAYNFSWLSREQISVLLCVLEYLSEEYGDLTAEAQERLRDLGR
ncbi:hypothetical protein BTA51_19600 [Hahella sp. CCB-MM4]|uniref:hypothetical protein n=1 Tax=Hahella sp. (strain CCB-MM4) TaxID=1926491 RepID=UPI000B9AD7AC|nr:hypothetical protein [Hahella sp. CCB-MM4]OZG71828.1 hypothetical protein BTA51_19600 [Hahella sp. CCB-MM4]